MERWSINQETLSRLSIDFAAICRACWINILYRVIDCLLKNAVGLSWWCEKDTVIHPITTGCTPFQCSTLPTSSSSGSDWFNKNIWRNNPFLEYDNANMWLSYILRGSCSTLRDLEALALLVSSLCHDIDHRGTTNSFQLASNSLLAALYSSEGSVMEVSSYLSFHIFNLIYSFEFVMHIPCSDITSLKPCVLLTLWVATSLKTCRREITPGVLIWCRILFLVLRIAFP